MEQNGKQRIMQGVVRGLVLMGLLGMILGPVGQAGRAGAETVAAPAEPALFDAFLYFAGPDFTHLKAEPRQFPPGLGDHELGRALLETLMEGPGLSGLGPIFTKGTRVNAFFITDTGDAYVDLGLESGRFLRTDTITELLGIYSLVNTLTVNIPGIKRVKILVNGREDDSFGGHIRLAPFFKTNMLIVQ